MAVLTSAGLTAQNYVKTTVYCNTNGNSNSARTSTVYYDGLGRERLSVAENGGGSGAPVALRTDYDLRGNVQNKWLPVPGDAALLNDRAFRSAASAFYGSAEIPYTSYEYEFAGLNRPIAENGPGKLWEKHGKTIARGSNSASGIYACKKITDSQLIFIPTRATLIDKSKLMFQINGNYPAGALRFEKVTDEDGKQLITFMDRLDRVLLQRTVATDGRMADTYFVYDKVGDLRYAISPEGSAQFPESGALSNVILDSYAQQFTYDAQHRCITSQAPGCEPVHYVYDKLGRVIFESTATQRAEGVWTLTKYDSQFRPAIKGTVKLTGKTRALLQSEYGASVIVEDPVINANSIESDLGYPGTSGPAGFTPYMSWMYDNYDFIVATNSAEKARFTSGSEPYTQKGLCTGTLMRKNGTGDTYFKAFKYDHNGNVLRTCLWDIYLQNYRITDEFEYDFVGNPLRHTEKYESMADGTVMSSHNAVTENTFDINGRLLTSTVSVNGGTPVRVQDLSYDAIGRVAGDAAGVGVEYGYDIRSNLTDIVSPVFSQKTWFGSTPTAGASPSYLFANASRLSWGGSNPYIHTESYSYDGFGHFSAMSTNNNQVAESMEADRNADVNYINRKYRGDVVQDALMTFSGGRLAAVMDASDPYWADAVPSFGEGDYTLEYDADGRLVKDGTRDITSISYHPFGNLSNMIKTSDGSYAASAYFPDGSLASRSTANRTIEIVTKVDANGDTTRTERARFKTANNSYYGNFESTPSGMVYHTAAGHYDIKAKQHYWFVRDRLGSTVAVVDGNANLLQTTGYYPSGTPYQLPAANLVTAIDATTDQLHIGNRWIGVKGLALYDNTARMHDPLLARFHTVDPLFTDYPGQSPWSHCAANPVNAIDPDGLRPIYSPDGLFLGADESGLEGDYIVMDENIYRGIMNHSSTLMSAATANKYAIDRNTLSAEIRNKIEDHFNNTLPNRPDYDGYITLSEANEWFRNGTTDKDGNKEPLFADFSKIDLSGFTLQNKPKSKEQKGTPISLLRFTTQQTIAQINNGLVYGSITIYDAGNNNIKAMRDIYDFDMHPWSGNKIRNIETFLGELVATNCFTSSGSPFKIFFYGTNQIKVATK